MKYKKLKIDFKDKRGSITDIFYKKNIQHVAIIDSKPNVRRGDHYHKKTRGYHSYHGGRALTNIICRRNIGNNSGD